MYTKLVLGLMFSVFGFISQHNTAQSRHPQTIDRLRLVLLAGVLPSLGLLWIFYDVPMLFFVKFSELVFALGFALFISEILKNSVIRIRPYAVELVDNRNIGELVPDTYRSFPSAHSALATAGLVYLAIHMPPKVNIIPILFAIGISFSRVIDNMHYVSDVVAGIGIGLCGISLAIL